jgi:hypothetical protein
MSEAPKRQRHLFICHSSQDKSFIRRLASDLKANRLDVWVDEQEILVGDRIREKIEAGIETSDYLAIVLSPASVNSPWVQRELDAKLFQEIEEKQVKILPLLLQSCDIPPLLRMVRYADFRGSYESGLRELLQRFGLIKENQPVAMYIPPGGFQGQVLQRGPSGELIWDWVRAHS